MVSIKIATIAVVLSATASVTATRFHVNKGCIILDGTRLCAGSNGSRDVRGGTANVEAKLDSDHHCHRTFTWPESFGDVYFAEDNCLYDTRGQNIGGQCC